jgi:multidrug efflux pump subunit AcrA (membrane-fusion protein)
MKSFFYALKMPPILWSVVLACCSLCSSSYAQLASPHITVKTAILKPIQSVSVAAGVSGVIERVLVKEGDLVSNDQVVVRIRCDEAILQHQRAKIALETATAKALRDVDIRLAEKSAQVAEQELGRTLKANALAADTYPANEVDRYRLIFERSKLEVERFKLDQHLAQLALKQAEIETQQTQQAIDRHNICSRTQSMVVAVDKHAGEWVDPNTKILELMSIDRLRVEGFIDANDAIEIEKGQLAIVSFLNGKLQQTQQGVVAFVSPIANPANGQIRIFIEVDNPNAKYRPGMSVSATVPR